MLDDEASYIEEIEVRGSPISNGTGNQLGKTGIEKSQTECQVSSWVPHSQHDHCSRDNWRFKHTQNDTHGQKTGPTAQKSHGQQKNTPYQLTPDDDFGDGEMLHCPCGWDRCNKVTEVERTSYPRVAIAR